MAAEKTKKTQAEMEDFLTVAGLAQFIAACHEYGLESIQVRYIPTLADIRLHTLVGLQDFCDQDMVTKDTLQSEIGMSEEEADRCLAQLKARVCNHASRAHVNAHRVAWSRGTVRKISSRRV